MRHLRLEQRYAIEAYLKSRKTKVFIAKQLGFDESTIRREIKR
ncbi:MAG: helix-turn-helix domain-containing protein, partial [Mangrovibacterium sp.]